MPKHCSDPFMCWRCATERLSNRYFDMAERWKRLGNLKEAARAERKGMKLLEELAGL